MKNLKRVDREKLARYFMYGVNAVRAFFSRSTSPRLIFVLGYGRSGTSIIINLLGHVWGVDAHGETSRHFMDRYFLDVEKLDGYLKKRNILPCVALKPILNSCEASFLLSRYENSKVVWMYRDYTSVTESAVKKFGHSVGAILKLHIEGDEQENWLSSTIRPETCQVIKSMNYSGFNLVDWTALVWWSVNHSFFSSGLDKEPRVIVVKYDSLVSDPRGTLNSIFSFVGLRPGDISKYITTSRSSVSDGVVVSHEVRTLCEEMMNKLNRIECVD